MNIISDNDLTLAKDKECYLLFYFTASWCGPCKRIQPFLQELSEKLDSSIIEIYKIDIDDNEEIVQEYDIKSVPTFFLIKDKIAIDTYSGSDKVKLSELIKKIK